MSIAYADQHREIASCLPSILRNDQLALAFSHLPATQALVQRQDPGPCHLSPAFRGRCAGAPEAGPGC